MAKILQVIFAIYCLVEIISPWPVQGEIISPWPIQHNTTLELKRLNKSLSDVCGPIKVNIFLIVILYCIIILYLFACVTIIKEGMKNSIHSGANFSNMSMLLSSFSLEEVYTALHNREASVRHTQIAYDEQIQNCILRLS